MDSGERPSRDEIGVWDRSERMRYTNIPDSSRRLKHDPRIGPRLRSTREYSRPPLRVGDPESSSRSSSIEIPNPTTTSSRPEVAHNNEDNLWSSSNSSIPGPLNQERKGKFAATGAGVSEADTPDFSASSRDPSSVKERVERAREQPSAMAYRFNPDSKGKSAESAGRFESNTPFATSHTHYTSSTQGEGGPSGEPPSQLPYLLSKEESDERMKYWREKAEKGQFNADTHTVDPAAHYSYLYYMEQHIVTSSYYAYCRGDYLNEKDLHRDWAQMTDILEQIPIEVLEVWTGESFTKHPPDIQETLDSVSNSYAILCRVLNGFDYLSRANFCGTFFSILVHSTPGAARLAQVHRSKIVTLKNCFQDFLYFHGRDKGYASAGRIGPELDDACRTLVEFIGLDLPNIDGRELYRLTVLVLDLGLVAYAGSHGSRFGLHVGSNIDRVDILTRKQFWLVTCSLERLACLNGFLNTPVWVFKINRIQFPHESEGLSILTCMDAFADIWGPVWAIPAEQKSSSNHIKQYNLSRGCIRRTENELSVVEGAVVCHWYGGPGSTTRSFSSISTGPLPLAPDDLLSIGAALSEYPQCSYKLKHYERDYLDTDHMGQLGTIPPEWRLEARTLGFSGGQYFGVTGSLTQKMLPGVTLKESIWNEISQSPQMANIEWLNNFYGVEISHCSGSARRVRMKDLFRVKGVQKRLGRLIPGWKSTPWGIKFSRALGYPSTHAIRRVWEDRTMRKDIGKLITGMLRLLHTTGGQGNHVIAAYFNNGMDRFTDIPTRGNEWAKILRDTTFTATYAVIGDTCLKSPYENSGNTCSQDDIEGKTVLQTRIKFNGNLPSEGDYVTMKPIGKMFCVRTKITNGPNVTLILATARTPLHIHPSVGREVGFCRYRREEVLAIIEASQASHGGMNDPRQLVPIPAPREQIAPFLRWSTIPVGNGQEERRTWQQQYSENEPQGLQRQRTRFSETRSGYNTPQQRASKSKTSRCCFQ